MPEPILALSALAGYAAICAAARSGPAVSDEAASVRDRASAVIEHAEQSFAMFGAKSVVISQLVALAWESAATDDDGTEPVGPAAIKTATDLIRALPVEIPLPEVGAEPDGGISLDWIYSRYSMLSVSVGTTNRLAYAWLDGSDSGHAVARFDGTKIPAGILGGIESVMGCVDTTLRAA